jgi:hypothetical protein
MREYTLGELDRKISELFDVKTCIKLGGRSKKKVIAPRALFCWVCSDYEHSRVWNFLNFKDHTSFYYYLKVHDDMCATDHNYNDMARKFLDAIIVFDHPDDSKQALFYRKISEIERMLQDIKQLLPLHES